MRQTILVAGYVQVMPAVYCGLFPTDAEQFEPLREALGRLQLNDAALQFEPEVSNTQLYAEHLDHAAQRTCTSAKCCFSCLVKGTTVLSLRLIRRLRLLQTNVCCA